MESISTQRPETPAECEYDKWHLAETLKQYWKLTCTTNYVYPDDTAELIRKELYMTFETGADQAKSDLMEQYSEDRGIDCIKIRHTQDVYVYKFLVSLAIKWEVGYDEILKDVYKNSESGGELLKEAWIEEIDYLRVRLVGIMSKAKEDWNISSNRSG